jgi:hypothetical protein
MLGSAANVAGIVPAEPATHQPGFAVHSPLFSLASGKHMSAGNMSRGLADQSLMNSWSRSSAAWEVAEVLWRADKNYDSFDDKDT